MSCQLRFLEAEDKRDLVSINDDTDTELAVEKDMLHNRNYRDIAKIGAEMSAKVLAALGKDSQVAGA